MSPKVHLLKAWSPFLHYWGVWETLKKWDPVGGLLVIGPHRTLVPPLLPFSLSGHHTLLAMIYFLAISPKAMGPANCGLKSPKL
jgi:hypothetical protein